MEAAARNHHALAAPQRGTAVALLQGGLVEVGFSLPLTMKKGTPDGSYGSETVKAVAGFQTANHLSRVDGIAGRETILSLDDMLAKQAGMTFPIPSALRRRPLTVTTRSVTAIPRWGTIPEPGSGTPSRPRRLTSR